MKEKKYKWTAVSIGDKHNRLTVTGFRNGKSGEGRKASCLCECGSIVEVRQSALIRGATRSCGCLQKERAKQASTTHGKRKVKEYSVWNMMRRRCYDVKEPCYIHYGGRGIEVCERWRTSFEHFYADMQPRPSQEHTLERVDVNGDYCPENCKWATRSEQNRNKRTTKYISHAGKTMIAIDWDKHNGWKSGIVSNRIFNGWNPKQAVSWPLGIKRKKADKMLKGETDE